MQPLSVLLVPYLYPPAREVGAHRPAAMAKYLRRLGMDVTVLTTSAHGTLPGEGRDGDAVVRTGDLRRVRARLHGRSHIKGIYGTDTYSVKRHPLSYLTVPDRMIVGWVPFALRTALSLHRKRRFDGVVTSSPPESTHLVGRTLAAAGCAWVADLEDGWTYEAWRSFPTALQRRADEWLERRLLRSANVVTCATKPVADDLRARIGANTMLVPHGFDPDLIAATDGHVEAATELLDPGRVSVVYTGRIGAYGRDLVPLLDALRELSDEEPELAERLEIAIAGPMRENDRDLLDLDLSPLRISVLGALSHQHALALQRAADVLLLFGSERSHVANLKLYEYLGAERPILALAEGTEAGRIVTESGGATIRADDPPAIKAALRRAARAKIQPPTAASVRESAYPAPAALMAEAIEEAIRRSGAARTP